MVQQPTSMKWSFKIARFAGIDVYVHATFLLLLTWIGWHYWLSEGTLGAVIVGIGFILLLFSCVVLHEFGHALAARRYGIRTRNITLLPIGGVASLERMPDDPRQEIIVALAGPAVNLVIALLLWLWLLLSNNMIPEQSGLMTESGFLHRIMVINLVLALFNLLPAFPMDGGRVMRAALSMWVGHRKATRIAANIGQALAMGMGILGLLYNPFLMFIAVFIWIGAAAEAGVDQIKHTLENITAGNAMISHYQTLSDDDPLSHAIALTLAGSQKAFPVQSNNKLVGVLTQSQLLRGLQEEGEHALIRNWMQSDVQQADVNEPIQKVLERLQNCQCPLISVTKSGRTVGIVDLDNINELINIQAALHQQHQSKETDNRWKA